MSLGWGCREDTGAPDPRGCVETEEVISGKVILRVRREYDFRGNLQSVAPKARCMGTEE